MGIWKKIKESLDTKSLRKVIKKENLAKLNEKLNKLNFNEIDIKKLFGLLDDAKYTMNKQVLNEILNKILNEILNKILNEVALDNINSEQKFILLNRAILTNNVETFDNAFEKFSLNELEDKKINILFEKICKGKTSNRSNILDKFLKITDEQEQFSKIILEKCLGQLKLWWINNEEKKLLLYYSILELARRGYKFYKDAYTIIPCKIPSSYSEKNNSINMKSYKKSLRKFIDSLNESLYKDDKDDKEFQEFQLFLAEAEDRENILNLKNSCKDLNEFINSKKEDWDCQIGSSLVKLSEKKETLLNLPIDTLNIILYYYVNKNSFSQANFSKDNLFIKKYTREKMISRKGSGKFVSQLLKKETGNNKEMIEITEI